jgi:hypothetical protein
LNSKIPKDPSTGKKQQRMAQYALGFMSQQARREGGLSIERNAVPID